MNEQKKQDPPATKKLTLEYEDIPEEETIIIERIRYHYSFFKQIGMKGGLPMGALLQIEKRYRDPNHPEKGWSCSLNILMTQEQAQKQTSRIVMPKPGFPGKKVH